jgi:hypothetical protein
MESSPNQLAEGHESRPRPADNQAPTPASGTLRSITRLVIGGVLLGTDELMRRLPEWEREAALLSTNQERVAIATSVQGENAQPDRRDIPTGQTLSVLVGLFFESQTYLNKGVKALGRVERAVWRLSTPVRKPLENSRALAPARRRYERLAEHGETEVARWVELGRTEEQHSRALAQTALGNTVYESIGQVVQDPRLETIVQERGVTLAGEVADEVRGRTVSGDALLENVARRLFRRAPREISAEPPVTIRSPTPPRGD